MGFAKEMVARAIMENGGRDLEAILESLLAYQAMDEEPFEPECSSHIGVSSMRNVDLVGYAPDDEHCYLDDIGDEAFVEDLSDQDKKFLNLVEMGFTPDEVSSAINRCGQYEQVSVLADAIYAAQMVQKADGYEGDFAHLKSSADEARSYGSFRGFKRKKIVDGGSNKRGRHIDRGKQEHPQRAYMSGLMVGFGLPNERICVGIRRLPDIAEGPPYFYFENVAFAPTGVWENMSRFLYDIEPEFV